MSDQVVRLDLEHVDDANEAMRVDVVLSGGRVKPGSEYFGMWYDKANELRNPFVLCDDGQIDYGDDHEDDDQYYGTDILDKTIAVGETITCWYEDEEFDYKIVKLTPLP